MICTNIAMEHLNNINLFEEVLAFQKLIENNFYKLTLQLHLTLTKLPKCKRMASWRFEYCRAVVKQSEEEADVNNRGLEENYARVKRISPNLYSGNWYYPLGSVPTQYKRNEEG